MKRVSPKRRKLLATATPLREQLIEQVGICEFCLRDCGHLDVHEISRGSLRGQSLDKRFACVVLGRPCHDALHRLAGDDAAAIGLLLIERSRPTDSNIEAFYQLLNRRWPPADLLRRWRERLGMGA